MVYTFHIHGVPVVWRVTLSYMTHRVDFRNRYWSQGALLNKDFRIYSETQEWSTFISDADFHAQDFKLAEDLIDWMDTQFRLL